MRATAPFIASMDKLQYTLFFFWQGGGVNIWGGEVTFTNCNIYKNIAENNVRAQNLSIAPLDG